MKYCKIFKNAKEGNVSFQVTQKLLKSAYEKARKAKKKGMLVISIPAEEGYKFKLECILTKEKK
ncbi:MAG: hypothetical protein ACTSWG_10230, partial [Candidatus Helarchaeota archaeon]